MLDNLQLLFVYAPVMNVQMILDGIFIGAVFRACCLRAGTRLGCNERKKPCPRGLCDHGGYIAFTAHNLGIHPIFALPFIAIVMFLYGLVVYQLLLKELLTTICLFPFGDFWSLTVYAAGYEPYLRPGSSDG